MDGKLGRVFMLAVRKYLCSIILTAISLSILSGCGWRAVKHSDILPEKYRNKSVVTLRPMIAILIHGNKELEKTAEGHKWLLASKSDLSNYSYDRKIEYKNIITGEKFLIKSSYDVISRGIYSPFNDTINFFVLEDSNNESYLMMEVDLGLYLELVE